MNGNLLLVRNDLSQRGQSKGYLISATFRIYTLDKFKFNATKSHHRNCSRQIMSLISRCCRKAQNYNLLQMSHGLQQQCNATNQMLEKTNVTKLKQVYSSHTHHKHDKAIKWSKYIHNSITTCHTVKLTTHKTWHCAMCIKQIRIAVSSIKHTNRYCCQENSKYASFQLIKTGKFSTQRNWSKYWRTIF